MAKRKTNKIAYSHQLKSYIKCVFYKGSTEWKYVLCDAEGNVKDSIPRKAVSYYSLYDWKERTWNNG